MFYSGVRLFRLIRKFNFLTYGYCNITLMCFIRHVPVLPKPFKRLDTPEALKRYGETGGEFLAYCILVAQEIFPRLPACPLPDLAKELLLKLSTKVGAKQPVPNSLVTACFASLFIHTISWDLADTSFHALQYLLLRMIKQDGSYQPHFTMTLIIAQLQYCVRMAFLNLYLGIGAMDELCLMVFRQCLNSDKNNIWTYLTECGENTPFWAMRQWMRQMATATLKEGLPDSTFWMDTTCTRIKVGKHAISLDEIKTTLQKTVDYVETLMVSATQGVQLPPFNRTAYTDEPSCTDVGFNYLVSSQLYHQQFGQHFLLRKWLEARDPWGFVQEGLQEGSVTWNGSAIQRWLNITDELTKTLYFCFHCGCGQPARGVEEGTIKFVNTAESARNVFWRGEQFMIQTMYHKTQSITGHGKNRVTFLPGLLSQHLHNYLAFVRPMQM